jgi:hypothetical protein
MRAILASLAFLTVAVCITETRTFGDDTDDAVQKAQAAFDMAETKQKEQLVAAFEKAIKDVSRAGDLDVVELLRREQTAFNETGALPASPKMKAATQKYARAMKPVTGKLESALEKAITARTKAGQLDEAKMLQTTLAELRSRASGSKPKIEILSATWAYDGRFGPNDGTKEDVREKVEQTLERGKLQVGLQTLGDLSGASATKALFAELRVGKPIIVLRMAEGSVLEMGEISQADGKQKAIKLPNTSIELISANWIPDGGGNPVEMTADYIERLKAGSVEVSPKTFPKSDSGRLGMLEVTYRVFDQRISFRLTEGSMTTVAVK